MHGGFLSMGSDSAVDEHEYIADLERQLGASNATIILLHPASVREDAVLKVCGRYLQPVGPFVRSELIRETGDASARIIPFEVVLMTGAARVGDLHVCSLHVGGPVLPPGSIDVIVNKLPVARATDALACAGPGAAPDFIVTGSTTVVINGLPAARQLDMTMHGAGQVVVGSLDVIVGGPTGGVELGNAGAAEARFLATAEGRNSRRAQQSYGNCGIESARQIIAQATGSLSQLPSEPGTSLQLAEACQCACYEAFQTACGVIEV